MRFLTAGILGVAILCAGCSKSGDTMQEREVRSALEAHLQKKGNLALNNMDMQIQSVKVNGDTAEVQVRYQSKEKPELAVGMQYVLRRAGDHWEVESSSPGPGMGGDSHQSAMPGGAAHGTTPPEGAKPEASH